MKKINTKTFMCVFVIFIIHLSQSVYSAESLNTFTFQGHLENSDGVPISSTINMTFKIYDNQNNCLWTESKAVTIIAGGFDLMLGKSASNPIAFTVNEQARYIGLAVGGDPEMEPRQEIGGVLRAGLALSVTDTAITSSKLADNAVTTNKIANNAISSDKIADNTVISAKLAGPSSALTNGTYGQTLISNGDGTFSWGNASSTGTSSNIPNEVVERDASGNFNAGMINVSSGIKLGTFSTCNSSYEGLLRYNSTTKVMEYCDGSEWVEVSKVTNHSSQTFSYSGSIDTFTVPSGITTINIEAWGAQGGYALNSSYSGGYGARMKGDFTVTPGSNLKILVGQQGGSTSTYCSGGGGGSFVWVDGQATPLIVAGGGGGGGASSSGSEHGTTNQNGNSGTATEGAYVAGSGGTGGNGGGSGEGGNSAGHAWGWRWMVFKWFWDISW